MQSALPTHIAFAPRLSDGLVVRQQLIDRVESLSSAPLLIVRAPGGAGKSLLLAAWAAQAPRPGVWITLDRSMEGRLEFWRRLVEAIVDAGLTDEHSPLRRLVISADVAESLRATVLRSLTQLSHPITVILDDYQHALAPEIDDDLHWLLGLTDNLRVIISTRTVGELELPTRMARVDTQRLHSEDLLFSAAETEAAATALGVDPVLAAQVSEAFGGWPLATRAALLELASEHSATVEDAIERITVANDSIPIPDDTADPYARFVLSVSIAASITVTFAREVDPNADDHLERAEREGLGTWSALGEFVLQPHLRQRAEELFAQVMPSEVARVRAAYAKDRFDHRDPLEAVRQYVALGDVDAIVGVVRRDYGMSPWMLGLKDVLSSLAPGLLRKSPELIALQMLGGNARATSNRLGLSNLGSLLIGTAQARLGRGNPVDRVTLLLAVLAAQRLGGHYEQAARTAEQIVAVAGMLDSDARSQLTGILPIAWIHAATTFFYEEQPVRAEELLRMGIAAATESDRPWAELHASSLLSLIAAMRGDHSALHLQLEAARARERPYGWRGSYYAAGHHLAEAIASLEQFDGSSAREELAELAAHEHTIEHWPLIARVRALSFLVDGSPYQGLESLSADIAAHADRPGTSRSMQALLVATRGDLLLADRQPRRALAALQSAHKSPSISLVRARIDLAHDRNGHAMRLAAPLAWSDRNYPRVKAEALLIVGVASQRLGRTDDARLAIERALEQLDSTLLRRPLMTVPRSDLIELLALVGVDPALLLEGVPDLLPRASGGWGLTTAELRVLAELEHSGRVESIAATLHLSANTVKFHLRQIYRKLGASSREETLAVAHLNGLLDDVSDRPPAHT